MFPLSVKLKRKLHPDGAELSSGDVQVIFDELTKLKIDKITIEGTHIKFKNYFFNNQGRTHLMATVDCGFFDYSNTTRAITYQFSTLRLFCIALIMSLFFGAIARSIGVALFFFTWLYGMNLIICLIRHNSFLKRLIRQMGDSRPIDENKAAHNNFKSANN